MRVVLRKEKSTYNKRSMTFFAEILRSLSVQAGVRVQYTVVDGQGGYFQNIKRIAEFSDTKIVFCGAKSGIRVEGKSLALGKYGGGDALVYGAIEKVEQIQ